LIRYRVGFAAVLKAALFSTWSFENSDCSETQTLIFEWQACLPRTDTRTILKQLSDCIGARN